MEPNVLIVSGTSYIVTSYGSPPTPTVKDIQVEGTAIAQVTLLPKRSGGGLLYSSSLRLAPGDPAVTVSRALVSIDASEPPVLYFSSITESSVFPQPSTTRIPPFGRLAGRATLGLISNGVPSGKSSGRAAATTSPTVSGPANTGDLIAVRNTNLEGGSIAAIVIGAMLVLGFGVLALYKALRHRRTQQEKDSPGYRDDDTPPILPHKPSPWETPVANSLAQTHRAPGKLSLLHLTHIHIHELEARPTPITPRELQASKSPAPQLLKPCIMARQLRLDIPVVAKRAVAEMSPHAEAQREREVRWLEGEERRLRERREMLMSQAGRGRGMVGDA